MFIPLIQMPDYIQTRDYLYSLKNQGSKYGIDRMRLFVKALEHPERTFPSIHVAGTNGKGSTCAMLEALYRSNGYSTGFFNSPHLVHQGERVQVNRQILSHADIVAYTEKLRTVAEALGKDDPDNHPSFFEFMVAMAFLRFAESKVDIALLETGLGGRLDATNVVDPELTIITSISLDHTELLGDTIEAIAREKAGIIKEGKPVLIGNLPPEAEAVIREIAQERNAPLHSVTDRFPNPAELPTTNLIGTFQRWNAAVAIYATELLADRFPIQSTDALQQIEWAGRWQTIQLEDRTLILDATHNPEGAIALNENLSKLIDADGRKPIIVAGTLGEDRGRSLMNAVAAHARELHLVEPSQPRATPSQFLESCLPEPRAFTVTHQQLADIIPAPNTCAIGNPGDTIVITGSLYLIGEALERLTSDAPQESGSLQDLL
ncbi:MAG: folylpolyglutamate synthase/dihydrofolate synthase family protein [Lentimonas sp.]